VVFGFDFRLLEMLSLTLEGRMPKGGGYIFSKGKITSIALWPFKEL
jgi:hypothetical protein